MIQLEMLSLLNYIKFSHVVSSVQPYKVQSCCNCQVVKVFSVSTYFQGRLIYKGARHVHMLERKPAYLLHMAVPGLDCLLLNNNWTMKLFQNFSFMNKGKRNVIIEV